MTKKLIALLGLAVLFNQNADAARNSRRNSSSARSTSSRRSLNGNVKVSGTTTSVNATVADTTVRTTDYTQVAPITDASAKRNCTAMVVKSLKTYCGNNKCKNATEAYAGISLPTDTTEANEIYCANFIEEAVNNLWNSYDSYAANDTKNCNIALARSLAAEECYRYVLTRQNEKVIISSGDLNSRCGKSAIKSQYKRISNGEEISDSETGDSLTSYFSKVGNIGWSNLAAYGRLLDLKIDFKTTEFPRDLIQLVNSLKSEGNMMCGEKNYTELYDANIALVDKTSSIERKINEKGLLAGGKEYIVDQIGAFKGTNWANDTMAGKTKEEREADKQIKDVKSAKDMLNKFDGNIEELTGTIKKNIEDKDETKAKDLTQKVKELKAQKEAIPESTEPDFVEKVNQLNENYKALNKEVKSVKKELDKAKRAEEREKKATERKNKREEAKKLREEKKSSGETGGEEKEPENPSTPSSSSEEGDGTGDTSGDGSGDTPATTTEGSEE